MQEETHAAEKHHHQQNIYWTAAAQANAFLVAPSVLSNWVFQGGEKASTLLRFWRLCKADLYQYFSGHKWRLWFASFYLYLCWCDTVLIFKFEVRHYESCGSGEKQDINILNYLIK